MKAIARFLGDPNGYVFPIEDDKPLLLDQLGWTHATIGLAGKDVVVDVSKAYLLEMLDGPSAKPAAPPVDPSNRCS